MKHESTTISQGQNDRALGVSILLPFKEKFKTQPSTGRVIQYSGIFRDQFIVIFLKAKEQSTVSINSDMLENKIDLQFERNVMGSWLNTLFCFMTTYGTADERNLQKLGWEILPLPRPRPIRLPSVWTPSRWSTRDTFSIQWTGKKTVAKVASRSI